MTKIIVFGNSHVGAWKEGWGILKNSNSDIEVTFFGAPQSIYRKMRLNAEKMFALNSANTEDISRLEEINGRHQIDLSVADLVVWAGFGWRPIDLARILENCDIDCLRVRGAQTRISQPGFDAICSSLANSILPGPEWQNWDAPKLYVSLQPLYAETCIDSTHPNYDGWQKMNRDFEGLNMAFDKYCIAIESSLNAVGIGFLRQPKNSLATMRLTDKKFLAKGGGIVKKGREHKRGDHSHMNGEFGVLCWQDVKGGCLTNTAS